MADSQDPSGQHAEGIQHIASNTAPPGTQDTSRGTEGGLGTGAESSGLSTSAGSGGLGTGAESGGVSSSQDFKSPLVPGSGSGSGSNLEQTSSQGGVINTVKSYLGYGNDATGSNASETGQLGTAGETRNAADTTSTTGSGIGSGITGAGDTTSTTGSGYGTGSGSGSGISGAAASAASAVGLSSGNSAAGGGLGSTSSSSGAVNDTTGSSSSTTGGSTLETAREKVQEVTNAAGFDKTVTSGTDEHKPPQPAGGKPKKLENESAIPTAGGERLGEKHWGESKIVPDNPEKRASEGGVSSEAGQPTQQTTDNTARNTGGATGPPGSSSAGDSGNGEEKQSMGDKIKDKLHIGK